ncbi:hypothetical protein [Streptomyces sp. 2A115]
MLRTVDVAAVALGNNAFLGAGTTHADGDTGGDHSEIPQSDTASRTT